MATGDGNNRNDPQDGGGDWFDQNVQHATGGAWTDPAMRAQLRPTIQMYYKTALGREGSDAELDSWIDGAQGNISVIHDGIFGSEEAKAYGKPKGHEDPVIPPTQTPTPPGTVGVPTSGFGAAPAPYQSDPNAPQYSGLGTYVPPTWTGGDYVNPTEEDLLASPGYGARLAAGLQARERSAAAQGTILNGGTQKGLTRYASDYASNEYQNLRNNTYDAYVTKYKQFTDAAGMDLNARTINANENQNAFQNRTNTYNTNNARTLSDFLTNVTNKRNSEVDYWGRLQDLNSTGSGLAGGSR